MRLTRKFLEDGAIWRGMPLHISVVGNHLVDEVQFTVPQAYSEFSLYLKIDGEEPNKLSLSAADGGFLWKIRRGDLRLAGETNCQLQAERTDGSEIIVWQSKPFTVIAAETIEADDAVESLQAPYLQQLDARVAANADRAERAANRAEQSGGGGTICDVGIEDVEGLQAALDERADTQTVSDHITNQANPHSTTAQQIGAAEVQHEHGIVDIDGLQAVLDEKADAETLQNHTANSANPHGVTAEQTGAAELTHGHAINDIDGLQVLLDEKATSSALLAHIENGENPHNITPAQIGAAEATHSHAPTDIEGLADQLNNAERFAAQLNGWIDVDSTPIAASAFTLDAATGEVLCDGNPAVEFAVNPQTGELMQIGEAAGVAFRIADGNLEVLTNAE